MNTTTVVLAAVIFALVGTMVFAAIAPYLSQADAQTRLLTCPKQSPNGGASSPRDGGCGPTRLK